MSATLRTQIERPQSPTWEEIETLLARELKMACGTRPRRRRKVTCEGAEQSLKTASASAGKNYGGNEYDGDTQYTPG